MALTPSKSTPAPRISLGQYAATTGFFLYAAMAPHSIAGAEISLTLAFLGWLWRTLATRTTGLRHTALDIPVWLFLLWTVASSVLSEEPSISIAKLLSSWVFLLFYLTHAVITRRVAVALVIVMLCSGVAGTLYSGYDLLRGRGVVVETITADSPFLSAGVRPGETIWRLGGQRVYAKEEIDEVIRQAGVGSRLRISLFRQGEHDEQPGFLVTSELKVAPNPSGIVGSTRNHSFRASGWTRHYETYAEILQILVQLALGLAIANLQNHGANRRFWIAAAVAILLAVGVGLTAMRTALVALAIGSSVVVLRGSRGKTRLVIALAIVVILAFGGFVVWKTRATGAISLGDSSADLRLQVARVGWKRIPLHPLFGHGMDSHTVHWEDWGFPGQTHIHLHSTPLQLAFERGLPAVLLWLWIMFVCWRLTSRAEIGLRDTSLTAQHGIVLGATGALAGFFASSLVNYNLGDAEVALVFWWLMGLGLVLARDQGRPAESRRHKPEVGNRRSVS